MEFQYKIVSSMCKVFPAMENIQGIESNILTGLKGETVSFQIAYFWGGEETVRGSVKVSSPIKETVRVRTVNLVPSEYPCHRKRDDGYLATQPGMYPDLLCEIAPWGIPLVPGQWRSLWIDFELDERMEAGAYPVKLHMQSGNEALCDVEILCEVLDIVLPRLPIPHTEWFHSDCLADYYGVEVFSERYWEIVEEYVKTAARRKCNMLLTPVFTPPLDTVVGGERRTVQLVGVTLSDGEYCFEFANLRRWIHMALRCGMEYFEISHLFTQWGAKAAPKVMAVKDGRYQQIFGWDTDASGVQYREFLHQFLMALKKELRGLGVLEKTYFHISDEPQMEHLETYRAAFHCVAEELKDCRVIDALSDNMFYREGLVREPVCAIDHIKPFLAERPEKLWGYYCTGQCQNVSNRFMSLPGYRTRILGAQLYKYQLDGFLHWGYNFYNAQFSRYAIDPYRCTDADKAFPSGDAFLVYPGKDGRPEESLRLMLMDEAMSDYCALKALEKLAGREKVLGFIDEEKVTFDEYPWNETYLLRLRAKVNGAIRDIVSGKEVWIKQR